MLLKSHIHACRKKKNAETLKLQAAEIWANSFSLSLISTAFHTRLHIAWKRSGLVPLQFPEIFIIVDMKKEDRRDKQGLLQPCSLRSIDCSVQRQSCLGLRLNFGHRSNHRAALAKSKPSMKDERRFLITRYTLSKYLFFEKKKKTWRFVRFA